MVTARTACRIVVTLSLLALGAGALAHHPISAKFDAAQRHTLRGIVTKVDWRSPHVHVFVNVASDGGLANWAIEVASPTELRASGWRDDTLRPGDSITVEGIAARDGTRQLWGESIRLSATGRPVYVVDNSPPPAPLEPRPTPRWPDGQPALGALPGGVDGIWSYPDSKALVQDGADIAMDDYGLLVDLDDAARVAPLQPWALALYRFRQQRGLRDDPMYLNCKPPGGPRQYQSNLGVKLVEDRERQRVFVLVGSGNHNYRIIYLDGRDPVGQVGGDDDNPLYYGRSVGAWEGDVLVVETTGFNEDFWFTNGGLPHTSRLRLTERFSRPDFDTLHYEVTVEDRGAYREPWKSSWSLRWVGGEELPFHLCQNNRP
jgi:hypothetical protein